MEKHENRKKRRKANAVIKEKIEKEKKRDAKRDPGECGGKPNARLAKACMR